MDVLNRVVRKVEADNRTALFYADRLQLFPKGISDIQGDPIVVPWHYQQPRGKSYDDCLSPFADHGIPIIAQSAALNYRWLYPDVLSSFDNTRQLMISANRFDASGFIMSAWTDSWSALTRLTRLDAAYSATMSWKLDTVDFESFVKRYSTRVYKDSILSQLATEAHLHLAEAASLTKKLYGSTSETLWDNPFSKAAIEKYNANKHTLSTIRKLTELTEVALRRLQESEIDTITLSSMLAGTKLLNFLCTRYMFAGRISDVYNDHMYKRDKRRFNALMVELAHFYSSLMVDIQDLVVETRSIFEEAWLNEYTTYRLKIPLVRFDEELNNWLSVQKKLRRLNGLYAADESLPPLDSYLNIDWD